MKKTSKEFPELLENFFIDWLKNHKKASPYTIDSYKYAFQLLLKYGMKRLNKQPDELKISDLNADFIMDFLKYLEEDRKICARSRNARLSAIKSFFHYVTFCQPESIALAGRILAIPKSKSLKKKINFLTEEEVKALLEVQNLETWVGRRDNILIQIALETGMRLSELISIKWRDITMTKVGGYIQCVGKGRKERSTPIPQATVKALMHWKNETEGTPSAFAFPSNKGTGMSSDCFQKQLRKYSQLAVRKCESLRNKKITPHILRHTTAMNLVQAHVELALIADILGHSHITTTEEYLNSDLSLKEDALNQLTPRKLKIKHFKAKDKLLQILNRL